jgi:hypothetical protein
MVIKCIKLCEPKAYGLVYSYTAYKVFSNKWCYDLEKQLGSSSHHGGQVINDHEAYSSVSIVPTRLFYKVMLYDIEKQ